MRNALLIGCGSKFGSDLAKQLKNHYAIYNISGSIESNQQNLNVDWKTCKNQTVEKFLRGLPNIDLIIFNQNYTALNDSCFEFGKEHIFNVWKRSVEWNQAYYVNCILPMYILHSIYDNKHLSPQSVVCWMLSGSIFETNEEAPVDYTGQKYQNYLAMKRYAANNPQMFIGVCIGGLEEYSRIEKSNLLVDFLQRTDLISGQFYTLESTE
jgi:hypothetical protein